MKMGIEIARKNFKTYGRIKNEVNCLEFLRQSLKENDGKYYIAGLSAYAPRPLFNTLKSEKIAIMKGLLIKAQPPFRRSFGKILHRHRSINIWEIDRVKLDALIKTKNEALFMIEF